MGLDNILLIPGVGQMSFNDALALLSPYSPRLAANYQDPIGSLYTDASRTAQVATVGDRIRSFTNQVTGQPHGVASSDAKSPLWGRYPIGGRRNLLTYSEDLSNAAWVVSATTKTTQKVTPNTNSTNHYVVQVAPTTSGQQYTLSFDMKADGYDYGGTFTSNWGNATVVINLTNGDVEDDTGADDVTVEALPDGWYRVAVTDTSVSTSADVRLYVYGNETGVPFAGDGTSGVLFRNVQFEQSATATNYQKVTTSADITEAGIRDVYGALFDGVDDCFQVSEFDLTNTDRVSVIVGVRKFNDAAGGIVLETSTASFSSPGAMMLAMSSGSGWLWRSHGTLVRDASVTTGFAAPVTSFLAGLGDIANDVSRLVVDGKQVAINALDQGVGNYGNYTLNIGGRNNSAISPFSGLISYLFVCGAIVPDSILVRIYRGLGPQIGIAV